MLLKTQALTKKIANAFSKKIAKQVFDLTKIMDNKKKSVLENSIHKALQKKAGNHTRN
ncbi:Uncharacterised protein [Orientia tsutsugamushi]|uniref:Uncharacterized protein n=1 Tax=Orientia tsutsugamushi TaxID=784 RepID=A0A2U3R4H1_ORITS|nr:hypothetical protein OTSUT76_1195 [Orientia tsutsugamushi str. UT76]SPR08116.1 Uncharacterised protein [Orientia tsutsugamushi]